MSYFNDDQLDHMRDLADASKKGLTCPCGWFLKTECERTCNSAYGSPEKHIAGQADVLIARLRHLVSLNEPRHGGPYQGTAAMACVRAMGEAADRIASLTEQVEGLTRERDEQRVMFLYEADKHSEWLEKFMDMKRRAEAAEAREKRLREALEPFAVEANGWADMWHDDYVPVLTPSVADEGDNERAAFTIGDLRRARAALEAL